MTARATEIAALSKIVRIMMSVALLVGMCASAPMQAQASESVEVTVGDDVPYAGYFTTRMWADGEVAYCHLVPEKLKRYRDEMSKNTVERVVDGVADHYKKNWEERGIWGILMPRDIE